MMQQGWIRMSSRPQGLERAVPLLEGSGSIHLVRPSGPNSVARGLLEESKAKMEMLTTCSKSSSSSSLWVESPEQRHVDQPRQLEERPRARILMY